MLIVRSILHKRPPNQRLRSYLNSSGIQPRVSPLRPIRRRCRQLYLSKDGNNSRARAPIKAGQPPPLRGFRICMANCQ